jgi:hypothetical protein
MVTTIALSILRREGPQVISELVTNSARESGAAHTLNVRKSSGLGLRVRIFNISADFRRPSLFLLSRDCPVALDMF